MSTPLGKAGRPAPGPTIARLAIGDSPAAWTALGFDVRSGECRVGSVALDLMAGGGQGILGWSLRDCPTGEIDGLPTDLDDRPPGPPGRHPNTAIQIDHVVVVTPSLDRTAAALDDAGLRLRRTRQAGSPDAPLLQGFFRLGEVILEAVAPGAEGPRLPGDLPRPGPADPASFWGLVFVVDDLERCAEVIGEHLGAPRDAVQPGRRIATLRRSAGLRVPVAFITPATPR